MTNQERDLDVADAVVETRGRPSIVWLIPVIAVLVGAFVAYRALSDRGPEITITFKTAGGLEAGKTKIKYKDVEIGVVESVALTPDLSSVVCRARMVKGAEEYLKEKSQFWVVEPRIAGGQVSGLTTLLSGAYIGADPVREGNPARHFVGLEAPPIVTTSEPGRFFELRSTGAGAISVGSPVFYRRIEVGRVVSSQLDPTDDFVTTPDLRAGSLRPARPRQQPFLERERLRCIGERDRRQDRHRVGGLDPDRRHRVRRAGARRPGGRGRERRFSALRDRARLPRSVTTPRASPTCCISTTPSAGSRWARPSSSGESPSER